METNGKVVFKTMLLKQEYDMLIERFKQTRFDNQTNHYFDTSRFSIKALESSLRVRERDQLELTLKKKKGYNLTEHKCIISRSEFEAIKETGTLPENNIQQELYSLIGPQKLINFMSLSTKRAIFSYGNGVIFIDQSEYLGIVDYELEYETKNYQDGKKEFINLIKDLNIVYKKSDKKIKRAYNALKCLT